MSKEPVCELCGEPMPPGETMFKFHGYSGPCPKPPLRSLLSQPKLATSSEKDWRAYYENKCREQRNRIAALESAVQRLRDAYPRVCISGNVVQARLLRGAIAQLLTLVPEGDAG